MKKESENNSIDSFSGIELKNPEILNYLINAKEILKNYHHEK
jgi:hypothetical protein